MSVVTCFVVFLRANVANISCRWYRFSRLQFFVFFYLILLIACNETDQSHSSSPASRISSIPSSSSKTVINTPAGHQTSINDDIWVGSQYEATAAQMELKQVSQHVYYAEGQPGAPSDNEGFMSNASIVIGENEVLVFDSLGTPSLAYLLLSKIKKITDKPIRKLILSHYHADHIYGAQVFQDIGAQIIAPLGAKTYINSPAAEGRLNERRESLFPWVNETTHIVKPDQYISKDEEISLGGVTLKIVSLGSTHSDGDLMIYVYPDNVLLAGDLMFEGRIPFIAGSNPGRWLKFVTTLDPAKFSIIIPGHGTVSSDPKSAVSFTKGYLNYLHTSMMKAVENLTPFDEAYGEVVWDKYEKYPAFQVNRMNAYFVFLELEAASVQ